MAELIHFGCGFICRSSSPKRCFSHLKGEDRWKDVCRSARKGELQGMVLAPIPLILELSAISMRFGAGSRAFDSAP